MWILPWLSFLSQKSNEGQWENINFFPENIVDYKAGKDNDLF